MNSFVQYTHLSLDIYIEREKKRKENTYKSCLLRLPCPVLGTSCTNVTRRHGPWHTADEFGTNNANTIRQ